MLTVPELEQRLAVGHEAPDIELKGPGNRTDKSFLSGVARAALGMSNRRDGGYVVIGIDDGEVTAMKPGLSEAELETWLDHDQVAAALQRYCDPPVQFQLKPMRLTNQSRVLVLRVAEFAEVPHFSKREYPDKIEVGKLYVRRRGVVGTSEVANADEMREVVAIAVEKALTQLIGTVERAGGQIVPTASTSMTPDDDGWRDQESSAW